MIEGTVIEVDGFNIVTQLNEAVLEEIANVTNGRYYHAADEESLQEIYENIDLQLTIAGEKMDITAIIAGISSRQTHIDRGPDIIAPAKQTVQHLIAPVIRKPAHRLPRTKYADCR